MEEALKDGDGPVDDDSLKQLELNAAAEAERNKLD